MLDLNEYLQQNSVRLIQPYRSSAASVVARVRREDGWDYICRIYDHPIPAYELAQRINMAELPQVYSYTRIGEGCVVEEEFVDGIRVVDLLDVYRPDDSQTAAIAGRVCAALQALHTQGVIHRDVKPENVLVTSSGRVVLLDLDASSKYDAGKTTDTRLLGTAGYAAPEQFGFGRSDVRTDLFSLGVMLNIMRTGKHPSRQLVEGPLRPIVEKCIEVNADKRYTSAEELGAQLAEFVGEAEICPECGFLTPGGGCLCCGIPSGYIGNKQKRFRWWPVLAVGLVASAVLALFLPRFVQREELPQQDIPQPEQQEDSEYVAWLKSRYREDTHRNTAIAQDAFDPFDTPYDLGLISYDTQSGISVQPDKVSKPTLFYYDLDGDGKESPYWFGVLHAAGGPEKYDPVHVVSVPQEANGTSPRTYAPAVFQMTDDGSFEPVDEFAPLLENAEITFYYHTLVNRSSERDLSMPGVYHSPPLYWIWDGAELASFHNGCAGLWIIEGTAAIGGQQLTNYNFCVVEIDIQPFL